MDTLLRDLRQGARNLAEPRFYSTVLGTFAGVALVLAMVGIYGVTSYAVGQRTHEIGLRIALGAERRDILDLVLGHGLALTVTGPAVGVAASLALTRLLQGLLHEVSASDPITFVAAPALFLAVALIAGWLPARRATRGPDGGAPVRVGADRLLVPLARVDSQKTSPARSLEGAPRALARTSRGASSATVL